MFNTGDMEAHVQEQSGEHSALKARASWSFPHRPQGTVHPKSFL